MRSARGNYDVQSRQNIYRTKHSTKKYGLSKHPFSIIQYFVSNKERNKKTIFLIVQKKILINHIIP
jgi:hypothetical protein